MVSMIAPWLQKAPLLLPIWDVTEDKIFIIVQEILLALVLALLMEPHLAQPPALMISTLVM
jgi:hypothetical protein